MQTRISDFPDNGYDMTKMGWHDGDADERQNDNNENLNDDDDNTKNRRHRSLGNRDCGFFVFPMRKRFDIVN